MCIYIHKGQVPRCTACWFCARRLGNLGCRPATVTPASTAATAPSLAAGDSSPDLGSLGQSPTDHDLGELLQVGETRGTRVNRMYPGRSDNHKSRPLGTRLGLQQLRGSCQVRLRLSYGAAILSLWQSFAVVTEKRICPSAGNFTCLLVYPKKKSF